MAKKSKKQLPILKEISLESDTQKSTKPDINYSYIIIGILSAIVLYFIYDKFFSKKSTQISPTEPQQPQPQQPQPQQPQPQPQQPQPQQPQPIQSQQPQPIQSQNEVWLKNAGCCVRGGCPWGKKEVSKKALKAQVCTTIGLKKEKMREHLSQTTNVSSKKLQAMSSQALRAAFLKSAIWPKTKQVLTVSFIRDKDFNPNKAEWVKYIIDQKLSPFIRLKFEWEDPTKPPSTINRTADIRITFDPTKGAYSAVGTQRGNDTETMNLGWIDDNMDYDVPAARGKGTVVIHEFCHALGMIHEHSREDAALPWNCDAVYQKLMGPPNNWDKETIDDNVFKPVTMKQIDASDYDPKSIMHYFFPQEYFVESVKLPHNTELSKSDKIWLMKIYPKENYPADILKQIQDNSQTNPAAIKKNKEEGGDMLIYIVLITAFIALCYYLYKNRDKSSSVAEVVKKTKSVK